MATPAHEAQPAPALPPRMLLVSNPHASSTTPDVRSRVIATLRASYRLESAETTHQGHAIELSAAAAADGYDIVVALGGDGTINEVANGLAGTDTALGCLPGGATNVYCRMLGIPRDMRAATALLVDAAAAWDPKQLDMGRVNDRWFTFAAGVGLDAGAVARVDRRPRLKARWGPWFFASMGLVTFFADYLREPPALEVHAGSRTIPAVSALFQNGSLYTYFRDHPIVLDRDGGMQSGTLGGVALTRAKLIDLPPVLWRALKGRRPVAELSNVEAIPGDRVLVRSVDGRPVPIQVDGDHIGDVLEARFSLRPGGLRVVC